MAEIKLCTYLTDDNVEIKYHQWLENERSSVEAVVLIIHGMAEHSERYNDFANYLVSKNIAVYAPDLRGHGKTAGNLNNVGYFCQRNGWNRVVQDLKQLINIIKTDFPNKKINVIGHSMGTFFARTLLIQYPQEISKFILSGTSYQPTLLLKFGYFVASLQRFFLGAKHKSKLLNMLSFGSFNAKFKPNRTSFDWLSCDETQVDKYVADPYCGFVCSTSFYQELFLGIQFIQKKSNLKKINKSVNISLVSGEKDVVGDFGKGVFKFKEILESAGLQNISIKIFKNFRHEILNELNKEEVYKYLVEELKS